MRGNSAESRAWTGRIGPRAEFLRTVLAAEGASSDRSILFPQPATRLHRLYLRVCSVLPPARCSHPLLRRFRQSPQSKARPKYLGSWPPAVLPRAEVRRDDAWLPLAGLL